VKITAGNMDKKAGPLLALTCLPVTYSGEEHNSTSGPILGRQTKGARRLPQRAVEDEVALSPSHLLIEERPLPHPRALLASQGHISAVEWSKKEGTHG
jgi:hypothetical protein